MTDKPAESAVERYYALEWVPDGDMGFDPGGREVKDAADAAIAELKAEVERLKQPDAHGVCDFLTTIQRERERAEAAEAEVEQWKEKERVLVRNRVEWQQCAEQAEAGWEDERKAYADLSALYEHTRTQLDQAEAERDRLAWMLERIRDSEYDRMSDADALADLAARYDARHFTPSRWQERA